MGHQKQATPIQTDNSNMDGMKNYTIQKKKYQSYVYVILFIKT